MSESPPDHAFLSGCGVEHLSDWSHSSRLGPPSARLATAGPPGGLLGRFLRAPVSQRQWRGAIEVRLPRPARVSLVAAEHDDAPRNLCALSSAPNTRKSRRPLPTALATSERAARPGEGPSSMSTPDGPASVSAFFSRLHVQAPDPATNESRAQVAPREPQPVRNRSGRQAFAFRDLR